MAKVSRFFFGFSALLFLIFAYWQWNDPDPEIWVSLYGFAAVMCGFAAFDRFFVPILVFSAIAALVGGIYYFPDSINQWIQQEWQQADLSMKTMEMEEARESFGLLIVSIVMSLAAYRGWREKRTTDNSGGGMEVPAK